jgi:transcriptional regulator with PAS, ATPase and Fis domain
MREGEASEVEHSAQPGTATFDQLMRRYEKKLIHQALIDSQGSVTKAAHLLGVSHQRLISLIKRKHSDLLSIRSSVKTRQRDNPIERQE